MVVKNEEFECRSEFILFDYTSVTMGHEKFLSCFLKNQNGLMRNCSMVKWVSFIFAVFVWSSWTASAQGVESSSGNLTKCDARFFERLAQMDGQTPLELRSQSIEDYLAAREDGDEGGMAVSQALWMHSYHLMFERAPMNSWNFKDDLSACGAVKHWKQGVQDFFNHDYARASEHFEATTVFAPDSPLATDMRLGMAAISALMDNPILAMRQLGELADSVEEGLPVNGLAALIMAQINLGNAAELLPICRAAFLDRELLPKDRFVLGLALLAGYTYEQDFEGAAEIYASLKPHLTVEVLKFSSFELINFYLLAADDFEEWLALRPMMLDWVVRNPDANFTRNASVRLLWMHGGKTAEVERVWSDARELVAFDWAQNQNRASVYSTLFESDASDQVPVFKVGISPDFQLAFWVSGIFGALLAGAGVWVFLRRRMPESLEDAEAPVATLSDMEMHLIARLRRHLESNGPDEFGLVILDQLQNGRRDPIVEKLKATFPNMNLTETEGEVLFLSIHGYSGKEIARIIDVSQGHVYNIRTQLKNLLGLEDNDFKSWYRGLT